MSLLQNSNAIPQLGGYDLTDSLRFRSSASAYLSRTPASAGNRKTFTFSAWIKKSSNGTDYKEIFTAFNSSTSYSAFDFSDTDQLRWDEYGVGNIKTNAVYRDNSAWYHIVLTVDTTQATASNRVKIYVNGEQVTSFASATYPSQNYNTQINNTVIHQIARNPYAPYYQQFDGYLTEVNFVDGQQLTPSDFGSYNGATGVWQPKKYTGIYGTNGFYLNFSDSSAATATALGKDYSGNSNNWTPNNIAVSGVDIAYSNYFNGTSHVATPTSNNLAIGSGDFTIELWFKKTGGPTQQALFAYLGNDPELEFDNSKIRTIFGGSDINGTTTIVNNVWYHVAWTRVSGQVRLYLNGTLEVSVNNSTNMTDNYAKIGRRIDNTTGFTGYITNVRMVKGTAVYTSNFTPPTAPLTAISGTQLLTLQSSSLVDNSSNNFSLTNSGTTINSSEHPFVISSSIDIMSDVPTLTDEDTANFATLNPLDHFSTNVDFSDANLKYTVPAGSYSNGGVATSTITMTSGKWYCEMTALSDYSIIGVAKLPRANMRYLGDNVTGYGYYTNGSKFNGSGAVSYGASFTTNDVIGVALDLDAGTLTFYKSGVSQGTAFTGLSGEFVFATGNTNVSNNVITAVNFGQRPFKYTPPTGYKKLNTYNLPDSTIKDGSQYFDVKLDTGANIKSTSEAVYTNQLEWIKDRVNVNNHQLIDSVRGLTAVLQSNSTGAETTYSAPSGNSVGWIWRASDSSAVSNTDGTITSTVSANPTAGFSVVTYTGTGGSRTVGHGLSSAPNMIIVKPRTTVNNWLVYHSSLGAGNFIELNLTNAATASTTPWNNTSPTSSVFSVNAPSGVWTNYSGEPYVAYCFSEVAGFSKFGSYTGNGSTDGTFVYTGFRPAFILWKRTDVAGNSWRIKDSTRNPYNETLLNLFPNDVAAENSDTSVDFVSNGFKNRSTGVNVSSATYIYMAFAENPFKNSLAR